jgi:hypothetical protein
MRQIRVARSEESKDLVFLDSSVPTGGCEPLPMVARPIETLSESDANHGGLKKLKMVSHAGNESKEEARAWYISDMNERQ